jgi:hypothetical protein
MGLCDLRTLFGTPYTGAHAWRIPGFDVALVDTIATLLAAVLLAPVLGHSPWLVCLLLLLISVPVHILFCVQTRVVRLLT